MGARQSSNSRPTSYSGTSHAAGGSDDMSTTSGAASRGRGNISSRERARSLGSIQSSSNGHLRIPSESGSVLHARNYTDSDTSSPDEDEFSYRTFLQASSLPVQLFSLQGKKN